MIVDAKLTKRQLAVRQRRLARERFQKARRVEHEFSSQLSAVGRQIGSIIRGFAPTGKIPVDKRVALQMALTHYGQVLRPWAVSVAGRMQAQVDKRDVKAWEELAQSMGRSLRSRVIGAATVQPMREALEEQVELITSLPLDAAQRVHDLTVRAVFESERADAIAEEIMRSGQVASNHARLIARTEVARTASLLTQVRAVHIGSEGYIWRTSDDGDVRPLHKKLEGKFIRWDAPPIAGENGEHAHAGQIYNCRCWSEPVIPDLVVLDVGIGGHPILFEIQYPLAA